MKRIVVLLMAFCLLLAGCAIPQLDGSENTVPNENVVAEATEIPETAATEAQENVETEQTEVGLTIHPLPDTTMENLTDAILSISLEEGGAYVDDSGAMQMDVTIYTYDKYDMVDIATLEVGDILVGHAGEVEVISKEQNEAGTIYINGGLENGGFDLVTDEDGVFYEMGYSDHKSWYEVGKATIRVSADFEFTDSSDLDLGEVVYYPGSFLVGEVTNYDFTPYNTTIRVENGQIVELNRVYIP